jgi:pimeloyl-ACP methyl ester carboxylesterase
MKIVALAAGLVLATTVLASPPTDWMQAPGATAEFVDEPVFGGRVALYRAGPLVASRGADAVVLVHGLGQNGAKDWSKLIPALASRYTVIAVDLPGFGHSDGGNHLYSPENFARVLQAVLAPRLKRPFALIGHSMGGAVSLAFAGAYPQRVSRLILVDAAGVLHRSVYAEFIARASAQRYIGMDSPWFTQVVRLIQYRAENLPLRAELALERAGVRQRILRGDPNAIAAVALLEHDFSAAIRDLAVPTLVIWGAADTVAPLRTGQALAASIKGARLTVLEGAGHAPQLEFPARFNPIVLEELDGQQLAAQPYALPAGPIRDTRVGRCDGAAWQELAGDYERVVLENCPDVRIADARIGYLRSVNSSVRVVNSHIRDGIDAKASRVELTGVVLRGSLVLDDSNLDAAGTRFESPYAVASNTGETQVVLRLSVSQLSPPGNAPRGLHDVFRIPPGEMLIR